LSGDDSELQRLQAKRLAEMQKNISSRESTEETRESLEEKIVNPRDVLIKTGEINEILDGGKLLALFRSIGLSVRMDTKINIQQDGKFVSLTDKLSNASNSNDDVE
jgi:DNA-binding TFAR19-related protein (PDSD5 family)